MTASGGLVPPKTLVKAKPKRSRGERLSVAAALYR